MQTRNFLIFFCLPLLLSCAVGYRQGKQRRGAVRKRMARPQHLLEDFAPISMAAGGAYGDGVAGLAGEQSHGSGVGKQCVESPSGCNVKEIFKPGDPKEKSSAIAVQAAQDAKAANEAQGAAGQAAAQHIKLELAEKAFQSAKAAEAALMGKQMMVDQLEQEVNEASAVIEQETNALQGTEINMKAAMDASRLASQQFQAFSELHKTFEQNLANIQTVAMGVQQEMSSKTQLLEAAQNRVTLLRKQLQGAHEDYEKTKQAAYKAACAAVDARQKASTSNNESPVSSQ
ncbi:uncharacterized protein LOC117584649 isoform X2 [Drosophila guanche]|uniref:Uncharacterized protein n=1 Tax=Drosophila guanche TaxID=7266 RepID=A0A3B0J0T0_DROGU|nr:uncharacterized protein LOC117584649 isoform X2 [Drosophila guanche]SPP74624.1 Hypothetical predicted protein [Drosophila guanche]